MSNKLHWTVLTTSLFLGLGAKADIGNLEHKPCTTKYVEKQGQVLQTTVQYNNWLVANCLDCTPAVINPYFIAGVEKLKQFGLKDQENAAIYDFDNNCVFVVSTNGSKIDVIRSYGASGGRGGVSNTPRSGGTTGGVHRTYLGAQEKTRIENAPLNLNLDPYKSGYKQSTVIPTTGLQDWETDFVLTRFIRLRGLEPQLNSTAMDRKILYHGTHEEGLLGYHESAGCIRMANKDVLEFYDLVPLGSLSNTVFSERGERRQRVPRSQVIRYDESKHPGLVKAGTK